VEVVVAGTGPAGGFPERDCPCAACRAGSPRRPAAALVTATGTRLGHALHQQDGVLWAPGGLRGAVPSAPVGVAVLGPGPDGDLGTVARDLAVLRAADLLVPDARVALVGATHDSARGLRRRLLLRAWGVSEPADGDVLPGPPPAPAPGRTLVIGGSASGKSALAEELLAASPRVTYLATGPVPDEQDGDWAARVHRHRERRPCHWRTVETARPWEHLGGVEPVLLDSAGSWLAGALDRAGAWTGQDGWAAALEAEVAALVAAWRSRSAPAVAVTDEVGWGVVPATASGRLFRDRLGDLNARLARESDEVLVVVAGRVLAADPA
jgi:adenosylcobinamide kinase/adenosylcobinamide-phosphate guanylyltransferase